MSTVTITTILLAVGPLITAVVILIIQQTQIQELESRLVAHHADMIEEDMREQHLEDEDEDEDEEEEESTPTLFNTIDTHNCMLVSETDFDLIWPYYITKDSAPGTHNRTPETCLLTHSNKTKGSKKKRLAHIIECMQRFIVSQGCIDNGLAGTFA